MTEFFRKLIRRFKTRPIGVRYKIVRKDKAYIDLHSQLAKELKKEWRPQV